MDTLLFVYGTLMTGRSAHEQYAQPAERLGEACLPGLLFNLAEMRLAMILKESKDGDIKVSMRSVDGQINVAEIANWFGGGGHVKSAGFSIRGRLEREGNYWQIV
jgi:phosphoesterase RecJ-like protein